MAELGTRMKHLVMGTVVLTLALASVPRYATEAQKRSEVIGTSNVTETVETTTRFAGTLHLSTPKGATVPLHVEFKEWYLSRTARGTELPEQGFYVAHLESGEVVTEIGDKSETRQPGDFWTVGKGTRMRVVIKAPREAVALQTIAVNPGR